MERPEDQEEPQEETPETGDAVAGGEDVKDSPLDILGEDLHLDR